MVASSKRNRFGAELQQQQNPPDEQGVQLFAARKKVCRNDHPNDHKVKSNTKTHQPTSIAIAASSFEVAGSTDGRDGTVPYAKARAVDAAHNRAAAGLKIDCVEVRGSLSSHDDCNGAAEHSNDANEHNKKQGSFKELGVSEWLCSVCLSLEMRRPTLVQQGCIPEILKGSDVIGLAETGSGKTAAFALPILQTLAMDPFGVFALTLTPTRELAFQIAEQFEALSAGMSLKVCVVVGGLDMQQQARQLASKPHVVVATPGRLRALLDADSPLCSCFKRAKFLVFDEADRVLDPTFAPDLAPVLSCLPAERQTLLFSATMTPSLLRLQQTSLADAYVYKAYQGLKTVDRLTQNYVFMPAKVKEVYLYHLLSNLQHHKVRSVMLFVSTRERCRVLAALLQELECPCVALHSGLPQKRRLAALAKFKSEQVPLLLATDVASRGLDIPTVDLVVNFDVPILAQDYVHRVGRTARAGRTGWCITFVTQHDVALVHSIEELVGEKLQLFDVPENGVLKLITRVYTAKKSVAVQLAEADGLEQSSKRNKRMKKLLQD